MTDHGIVCSMSRSMVNLSFASGIFCRDDPQNGSHTAKTLSGHGADVPFTSRHDVALLPRCRSNLYPRAHLPAGLLHLAIQLLFSSEMMVSQRVTKADHSGDGAAGICTMLASSL